jgi:predicted nucleic acid-binding protein
MAVLVFDSSVLCAFARAEKLAVLEALTGRHRRVVTRAVLDELERGLDKHPQLARALEARWIEPVRSDSLEVLVSFAWYKHRLGDGPRDIGEALTLAWAEINAAVAILDDLAARNVAKGRNVEVKGTLGLIAAGLVDGILDERRASELVDALCLGGARLPCRGQDFVDWCRRNDLL